MMNQIVPIQHSTISLQIKREDLLHPHISGNKFRKLKYNLLHAKATNQHTIVSFGGAFSNHILALAAAGKEYNVNTIGIIRGDELKSSYHQNPTLSLAESLGMKLLFVSRADYKRKELSSIEFLLPDQYLIIPEGGTNEFAIKGCEEILTTKDNDFDYICCAVGTGGTIAGIANRAGQNQQVLGFPALKADLRSTVENLTQKRNWKLINEYHFGGYAKVSSKLVNFINAFYKEYNVLLDPVYTGKTVFGVMDLIQKGYFPEHSKILIIHTGGLQGINGMNQKLKTKNLPLINSND